MGKQLGCIWPARNTLLAVRQRRPCTIMTSPLVVELNIIEPESAANML